MHINNKGSVRFFYKKVKDGTLNGQASGPPRGGPKGEDPRWDPLGPMGMGMDPQRGSKPMESPQKECSVRSPCGALTDWQQKRMLANGPPKGGDWNGNGWSPKNGKDGKRKFNIKEPRKREKGQGETGEAQKKNIIIKI